MLSRKTTCPVRRCNVLNPPPPPPGVAYYLASKPFFQDGVSLGDPGLDYGRVQEERLHGTAGKGHVVRRGGARSHSKGAGLMRFLLVVCCFCLACCVVTGWVLVATGSLGFELGWFGPVNNNFSDALQAYEKVLKTKTKT